MVSKSRLFQKTILEEKKTLADVNAFLKHCFFKDQNGIVLFEINENRVCKSNLSFGSLNLKKHRIHGIVDDTCLRSSRLHIQICLYLIYEFCAFVHDNHKKV